MRHTPVLFILLISSLFHSSLLLKAQNTFDNQGNDSNLYSIQKAWYAAHPEQSIGKDGEEERFKRWEHNLISRTFPSGRPINQEMVWNEWNRFNATQQPKNYKKGIWSFRGPYQTPTGGGGNGRINCIEFMPGNTKTIFAGTPAGGLWKTTNEGLSWVCLTDKLPNLGASDIAINPKDTNIMYIATGDAYGYLNGANVFWGGTYSMGVMKSMDGGRTWNPTKLSWLLSASKQVFRLLIYPHDPNIIIAAATDGIWRSVDAGETWVNTKTGNFKDLEFNVKNPSIIYASGKPTGGSIILRSIDTGRTWLNTTISGNSNSIILATTEAVDSILYAAQLNGSGMNIYRSENSGKTWAMKGTTSTTTFYSFYTMAIGVSNKDPDMVFLGGVDLVKSTNKGASFTKVSNWYGFGSYDYSHADHRVIKFYPGSKDKFINGNDGGVFQSTDAGVSYTDLSSNICALQFYRTGNSLTDEKFFIAGAQDNGVNRSKDGNWSHTRIGDGMESVVDPNNNDNVLAAIQYGNINVSYDGGNYFEPQKLNPATGNWIAPIVLNPRNSSTVFYGANFLYRSSNFGETWTGISKWNGANISDIVIPASDTNTIYFSIANDNAPAIAKIFRSTDGGKVWDNISGNGLPNEVAFLMDIAVDKHDAKKLYACYSGFAEGKKVYKSVDGGNSWNNFSDSLPNFPVNCVTVENSEEDGVYVGTDIGVFYRNNKMTGWKYWNDGLPAVIINELEILPLAKKIRAATFGRGVWEAEISGTLTRVEKVINLEQNVKLYPNPSPGHINLDYSTQFIHIKSISVINTLGQIVKILPEGQINPGKIYLDGIKSGIYLLTIHTSQGLISKKIQINSPD